MNDVNEDKLVARLSEKLALKCGMHPVVAKRLYAAAILHDVGKQRIPDSIVNKPGKLNRQEFEIMKTHTTHGAKMLESIQGEIGVMARTICANHHEWWSGGGYWGKYSCDLPPYVAIVEITDVFIALLSIRPYKTAWPPEEALEYIKAQSGTQFSPVLVGIFLELVRHDLSLPALLAGL